MRKSLYRLLVAHKLYLFVSVYISSFCLPCSQRSSISVVRDYEADTFNFTEIFVNSS